MSEPEIPQEWVVLACEAADTDDVNTVFRALAAVAPLIRADERERCAKVADADDGRVRPGEYMIVTYDGQVQYGPRVAERIAAAIRGGRDGG